MTGEINDIGFLGLGQMGAAIAERLEAPGVRLHIHDLSPACVAPFEARGARIHPSARAVAEAVPVVFACLPSPAVSLAVAAEVAGGAALTYYVEMSTIGRTAFLQVAERIAAGRAALIDAPVTGGPDGARAGTLAVLAAAEPGALAAVRPLLERIAGRLFVVGDRPGQGQMMKLVNNMAAATLVAATVEAVVAGAKAGLDPQTMVSVLDAGSGQSRVVSWLMPRYVLTGSFDFGATMATMIKDVDLALGEAQALDTPTGVTAAGAALWRAAAERVGAESDLTNIFRAAELAADIRLRSEQA